MAVRIVVRMVAKMFVKMLARTVVKVLRINRGVIRMLKES